MNFHLPYINKVLKLFAFFAVLSGFCLNGYGQTVGDYQTNVAGTWDWSTTGNWQRWNGTSWVAPGADGYPGQNAGTGTVTIRNNHNITLNVSPAYNVGALTVDPGANATTLTFGAFTLNVTGNVNVNSTTNNTAKSIALNTGTLNCNNLLLTSSGGNDTRDAFVVLTSGNITVTGNITMSAVGARTYIRFNGGGTVNVGGTISGGNLTSTNGGGTAAPTAGTVNFNGTVNQNIGAYNYWTLYASGSGTKTLQANTTIQNLQIEGTSVLDAREFQITGNAAGNMSMGAGTGLILGNPGNTNNISFPSAFAAGNINLNTASTVTYTANANQTVSGVPAYGNLTILSGNTGNRDRTAGAAIVINGNLTVQGGATYSASLLPAGQNITVNGTTNIRGNGIFNDADNNGTNTFTGLVTIDSGGQFSSPNNSPHVFRGGITNNGTFTKAGTGLTTFNTNAQVISGSNELLFSGGDVSVAGDITVTNQGSVSVSGALNGGNGGSAWINSTNSTLNYGNTVQLMGTGSLTATAAGNTVNYNGAAQAGKAIAYYNLTLSGTGVKTFVTAPTVNGTLSMEGSATVTVTTGVVTFGSNATLQYNTANARISSPEEWITPFTAAGGIVITNTGAITLDAAKTLYADIPITINSGANLTTNNYDLILGGDFTNNGIFAGGTGTVVFNGASLQTLGGSTNTSFYNLTVSNAAGVTLSVGITVSNTLSLASGNLSLGSGTNNLTIGTAGTISGTFDNNHMIVCDGSGSLIKQSNASGGLITVYPVGTGTFYTPFEITSLNATLTGTGSVIVRAVAGTAPGPPAASSTDLQKYWVITAPNVNVTSAGLRFTYNNPGEVGIGGDQSTYQPYLYTGGAWTIPPGASEGGVNPMTVTGATVLAGTWTGSEATKTYYSYQSGNWGTAATWTTDPSGTLLVGTGIPGSMDRVVILNGRTVTTTAGYTVLSTQINDGGTLDIGNTAGHNFGDVRGKGRLRLSTMTFPTGIFTGFVSVNGGSVEYYDISGTFVQTEYNNLILQKTTDSSANYTMTAGTNMTINGDLTLNRVQGSGTITLTVGNSTTVRNISINGDLLVNQGCNIATNNANAIHSLSIGGDFTNNGTVRFTNQAAPNYTAATTTGAVVVSFLNPADNYVMCNSQTDFYRIIINKGINDTYILNLEASAAANFRLFGPCNFSDPSTNYALSLQKGTVRIGPNINIQLAEGTQYMVYAGCRLWVDGGTVTVPENCNQLGITGTFRITAGTANCLGSGGIHLNAVGGAILVDGGTLNARIMRSSVTAGDQLGTFQQKGGAVVLSGPMPGNNFGRLSWWRPENRFIMSGGTLTVQTAGNNNDGIDIRSLPENISITGGTIIAQISDGRDFKINSRAPFWNFQLIRTGGTTGNFIMTDFTSGAGTSIGAQPLVVYRNLSLGADLGSSSVTLTTNSSNVTVAGNFIVGTGSVYTPGNNTTRFNGTAGQLFQIDGTVGGGLQNLEIINSSNTTITASTAINGNLTIDGKCFLNDQGSTLSVAGNITNSGTHSSQAGGSITLSGTGAQSISGDGNGVFGNLHINNAVGPVIFTANQTLTGNLRLVNGLLNIGSYGLSLGSGSNVYSAATGTATAFSGTKMISTAGNMSDGGITKEYSSTTAFTFPAGTASDYTPATIQFSSAPATWGSVNIKPVTQANPFVTSASSLNYFWKVTQTGFSGIAANSVSHTYRYVDSDIRPDAGTEPSYIPGVYNPFSWVFINDVSQVADGSNDIRFNNVSYVNGDYTAGILAAFSPVTVFYSRTNGDWNSSDTWSNTAVGGPACPAGTTPGVNIPGATNPVVIGDGGSNNHVVTIPPAYNNVTVGGLQISSGSTLDLTTSSGHNLGSIPDTKVSGTGLLRISAGVTPAAFPGGDFGNFLSAGGGTVEYYTSGTAFTLPSGKTSYNNLVISPDVQTITMPDINLIIYGNYTKNGAGTAYLNSSSPGTISVEGNLEINNGTLQYFNGTEQTVTVKNDINILAGTFNVLSAGTAVANRLNISGSLNNNGTFVMQNGTRYCNVYFTGDSDKVIAGTGTNTFNILNVDKGSSGNTILDVTANNLSLLGAGTALVLNNGTFRVSNSLLDFTLSTNTSFTIPTTAALSVNRGKVTIGTASSAGDLILAGRLEVINSGTVNIGTGGNYNNDIEYASGVSPEIVVSGTAILNVNGQIRRGLTVTTGSLSFLQTGGELNIAGRAANTTRAMFEITNPESSFTMSGGRITVVNGGNGTASFGDFLATPETGAVTGGIIQMGSDATIAGGNQTFNISSNIPLWDLVIDASVRTKTINLRVFPLVLQNNLTINGNSEFRANGLGVSIAGTLYNNNGNAGTGISTGGYQAGSLTQVTTFYGSGTQYIAGSGGNLTNFANLVFAGNSLTLSSNSNIRVNNDLTLQSGSLNDGSNDITVLGNISSSATHTSPSATGGIIMAGPEKQTVSGDGFGVFGNITINNSLGVDLTDNSTINGRLEFINGLLYINDYLLTLGSDATITGTPGLSRMIILNGVLSDAGVRKVFSSGSSDFTFPIGIAGKFTPVRYSFSSNSNSDASITIKPVNASHPFLFNAGGDELGYYWNTVSSGFSLPFTVSHVYNYSGADVSGNENTYVGGRFVAGSWTPLGGVAGAVEAANNRIILSGVSYLDGEYTAGESANFSNMPVLYSRQTGNWFDTNTWSATPGGLSCNCTPDGNPVIIEAAHTITIDNNGAFVYSVEIEGTLNAGSTVFHSLGHISGSGTLRLASTPDNMFVLPGGDFDSFISNPQSTIEFFSDNNASLPLKPGNKYKPYQNVRFTGTGIKYISAEDMKVMGNLIIEADATLSNTLFSREITIVGNWTDNNTSATGGFVPGSGNVIFNGIGGQFLTITGALTTEQFYNLQINNAAGMIISGSGRATVSNKLYLTLGNITTTDNNLLSITNTSPLAVAGGGSSSFINGPLLKQISAGSYFDFPAGNGNGTRYGNLYISDVSASGDYVAQYYNHNPETDGFSPASVVNPIDAVSNVEYWRLDGTAGATANVRVRWDEDSGIIPLDAASRTKLRIVEWNGSAWQNRGDMINDGGQSSGTIRTNTPILVGNNHYFTIGSESLPTATITSGNVSICNDGSSAGIIIALTGTAPWTIKYKVNGTDEATITNIASSPYTLVVSNAMEPLATLGPGAYVFNVSYISDASGSTGVRDFSRTVTVTLNESPDPVISGNTTVGIGEAGVVYSSGMGNIPGHTYSWSVSPGASVTSGQGTYSITVNWPSSFGSGWVSLQETVIAGGCTITTPDYVVSITDIPNPDVSGTNPVCLNGTYTYTTPLVGSHTYSWSLPSGGGIITGPSNASSVTVNWTSAGNYTVRVIETGSVPRTDDMTVTINPIPAGNNTVTDPSICGSGVAAIQILGTAPGLSFQLRLNADNTPVGLPVLSGPGGDITINVNPAVTTVYNVLATNEYFCSSQLADLATVTVAPLPVAAFSYSGTPYCPNAANPLPEFSGGGTAGTFSSTAGLVFVSTSTGQVNLASSLPGDYTVTNTIAAAGACSEVIATSPVTIIDNFAWTGASGADWNNPSNWSCNTVPGATNSVTILNVPNNPVLNVGTEATVNNLTIEDGAYLTVNGNTIHISGTITNNGSFDVTAGTVELNGTAPQAIGPGLFEGNSVAGLIINNSTGVTLLGPLNVTGVVLVQNGILASDGNLTLVSAAAQTALIDGSGAGTVTGDVTMQRYLPAGFGYKYFSSPFQAATVSQFGDDMDLASSFSLFYRFEENHRASGWVSYATGTNILNPLAGYAVNFGDVTAPKTVDVTGEVNNGNLSLTLFNHDSTYTEGFNLVGNPYPSPVNWDIPAGWARPNIDDAVYYFKASGADQYGGTYSSYVGGISTEPGVATNIIPSMQGFFVHVSDGTYPVTGVLGVNNSARINNLTHPFLKSAGSSVRFLIRAAAVFTDDTASADPSVIYFDDFAQPAFDGSLDALKLMNTDGLVTNFYSVLAGDKKLSVNALPAQQFDTTLTVPLGLVIYRDGEVRFKLRDIENLPVGVIIYFRDAVTGSVINMLTEPEYKVMLSAGDYNSRFSFAFLKNATGIDDQPASEGIFSAYESSGKIRASVNAISGGEGIITIYDMAGRPLYIREVYETGYYEFDPGVNQGIYIIGYITGNQKCTIKMSLGF